jgi:hypothetical protein
MRNIAHALTLCFIASTAWTEENDADAKRFPSPDKKLAYRIKEEGGAEIVKAKTGEAVLDLKEAAETGLATESGKVLWAPDSRRFAFNYRAGGRCYTCSVYELAGNVWKALPDFETNAKAVGEAIARCEKKSVKALGLPKGAYRRRLNDTWKVHRWIDEDTLEVFAYSEGSYVVKKKGEEDIEAVGCGILFTAKCDNKGGWKIVRLREPSEAELEKILESD